MASAIRAVAQPTVMLSITWALRDLEAQAQRLKATLKIGKEGPESATRSTRRLVAHRVPVFDQIVLLRATRGLTGGRKMNMDMSRALRPGVRQADVPLQSLLQSAGLGDIDWHPGSVLGLSGINIVARHRLELSVEGVDLVWVLGSRLPNPFDGRRGRDLRLLVAVE